MTSRQLLGVFVRFAGLLSLFYATCDAYYADMKYFGLPTASVLPMWRDEQGAIFYAVVGVCILVGAKWFVRLAYWQDD
jgi:hypothetical protein